MSTYTVWVGGIPDIEGVSFSTAQKVYKEWLDQGYDDILIVKD